jgi:hypothetical protein
MQLIEVVGLEQQSIAKLSLSFFIVLSILSKLFFETMKIIS